MITNSITVSLIHLIQSAVLSLFTPLPQLHKWTLLLNESRITKYGLPSCETTFASFFYDDDSFDSATNTLILNRSVAYILKDLMAHFFRIFFMYDLFCKTIANYLFYFISLCDSQQPGDGKILFFCVNCILQICRKKVICKGL